MNVNAITTAKSDLFFYTGYDLVKANTTWNGGGIVDERVADYTLNVIRSGLYGMRDDNYGRWIGSANIDFGGGYLLEGCAVLAHPIGHKD